MLNYRLMDTVISDQAIESPAERQARLELEADLIAEARASVAAGRVVPFEAVDAWMRSWSTPNVLPMPSPASRR